MTRRIPERDDGTGEEGEMRREGEEDGGDLKKINEMLRGLMRKIREMKESKEEKIIGNNKNNRKIIKEIIGKQAEGELGEGEM